MNLLTNRMFELVDGEMEIKKMKGPSSEDGDIQPSERAPGLLQQRIHRCAVQGCGKVDVETGELVERCEHFCPPQDFKMKSQLARHYATAHGFAMRTGSPRPVMKTRTAFYLHTTPW